MARLPPSLRQSDPNAGLSPRDFVSLLDLYPTLARLAKVPLAEATAANLQGSDLFQPASVRGNSTSLAKLLKGTSLEQEYPQEVYPYCEMVNGTQEITRALIAEGIRFIFKPFVKDGSQEGFFRMPLEFDSPYLNNLTESTLSNALPDWRNVRSALEVATMGASYQAHWDQNDATWPGASP